MTQDRALALRAFIYQRHPDRFLAAVYCLGGGVWELKVKPRGRGPKQPHLPLFIGPPVWVQEPDQWPGVAEESFGLDREGEASALEVFENKVLAG